MDYATRLRQAVRPQHAAQARAVATTKPRPAATAARPPLVPLQQSIGNRAVGRLVQAKLNVGRPGDRFEREADRGADQVMRMPAQNVSAPAAQTRHQPQMRRLRRGEETFKETRRQRSTSHRA